MKKIILSIILGLIVILVAVVLIVGPGDKPSPPYQTSDPNKSDPFSEVSTQGLIKDINYYVSMIEQVQGDPFRQVSRSAFLQKAEQVKDRLKNLKVKRIQLIDAYFYLQEVAAFLQDEHTRVRFIISWVGRLSGMFPLMIKLFNDRAYVIRDLSSAGVTEYAELVSINGQSVKEMIAESWKVINQTLPHYKRQIAEQFFGITLQAYFKHRPPWQVVYRHDGKEHMVEVPVMSFAEYEKKSYQPNMNYREETLQVEGHKVPVLVIPSFWYPDRNAYDRFMNDFFTRHKNKPTIVIDIRRNPGGDGRWAYAVLDYLTDSPYLRHRQFDFKISKPFIDVARYSLHSKYHRKKFPRLLWWFPFRKWIADSYWMDKAEGAGIGEYAREHDVFRTPDPKKKMFKGKVYLLVSHYTNSAAVVFAAIFKHHKMGIVVGQETGGRQVFLSDSISIEMPNSKLHVWIPVAILGLAGDNPDRGILPDVEVTYTLDDLKSKRDKDLEKVKELIRQGL